MANTAVQPLLSCHGLTKRFGERVAVDGVSFDVRPGEAYGLLGPNGAGKTTTIGMLTGLLDADAGTVMVAGSSLSDDRAAVQRALGYVPQDIALYPDLTARENLAFFGRLYGLTGTRLATRIREVLDLVELADRANDRVETFSGGMKRRVNLAAGLVHEPRVLIVDEPTVGVDPQSRNAILERIAALNREGMALLYTSHYMEEVERLCHRIGVMDEGRMIAEGTRASLIETLGEADRIDVDVTRLDDALLSALREHDAVERVDTREGGVTMLVRDGGAALPSLLGVFERAGVSVTGVQVVQPDLEAVFLQLTGKALRDE